MQFEHLLHCIDIGINLFENSSVQMTIMFQTKTKINYVHLHRSVLEASVSYCTVTNDKQKKVVCIKWSVERGGGKH